MSLELEKYSLPGASLRPMTLADLPALMELQAIMCANLPDPQWYVTSTKEQFGAVLEKGEGYGFFAEDQLAGVAVLSPWHTRDERGYAYKLGVDTENTYDVQDVMVHPDYRRQGMHSAFLRLFEEMARRLDGVAMYATVAPDNLPSCRSFEKAGYVLIKTQPAYDGRLRRYYVKALNQ